MREKKRPPELTPGESRRGQENFDVYISLHYLTAGSGVSFLPLMGCHRSADLNLISFSMLFRSVSRVLARVT